MTMQSQNPVLDMIVREHAELDRRIQAFLDWWRQLRELGSPRFNEMGVRMQSLREALAEHMRHEEASPLLDERIAAAPDVESARDRLRSEHQEILENLDRLSERLRACECDYCCWSEALNEFEAALRLLRRHEEAEVRLARTLASGQ
jgi:hypothetical protein